MIQQRNNRYYLLQVCICSLIYSASSAHAPYIVICGLSLGTIFFSTRFSEEKERLLNPKCVIFYTTLVWNFFILRRIQRDVTTNVHRFALQVHIINFLEGHL